MSVKKVNFTELVKNIGLNIIILEKQDTRIFITVKYNNKIKYFSNMPNAISDKTIEFSSANYMYRKRYIGDAFVSINLIIRWKIVYNIEIENNNKSYTSFDYKNNIFRYL